MVTEAIKREILRLDSEGQSPKQIRLALGLTKGTVAGELYRHRHVTKPYDNVTNHAARAEKPILKFPTPQIVKRPENEQTDLSEWERRRNKLFKVVKRVKVMHKNDVHVPYHDPEKLELWYGIASEFQPDIVVLGSDMFDLPSISRFDPDPDISIDDWQERSREYYWPLVHQLDRLLPNAIFVWIYGNHEHRALLDIKKSNMPKVGMAYFLETVRCGGRVLYVGRTEHVKIGSLIVAHGNKHSKFAADKIGLMWPDKTINFGDIHKHQAFGNAFSNGMLCQDEPHYDDWQYPNTQHGGTSTMTVDTQGVVSWSHHNFVQSSSGLWTQYGSEVIEVKQEMAESEAA
jgi:hypothetical protein